MDRAKRRSCNAPMQPTSRDKLPKQEATPPTKPNSLWQETKKQHGSSTLRKSANGPNSKDMSPKPNPQIRHGMVSHPNVPQNPLGMRRFGGVVRTPSSPLLGSLEKELKNPFGQPRHFLIEKVTILGATQHRQSGLLPPKGWCVHGIKPQ